ncbi:exocyst complex component EXO70E2-like [Diospyros lotus]|uniref:exocyst complex component EXO70E2-like n=1 Tax=Diospyros lotus TaxID=55363 RepID=UPI00225098F7|nr:exocyst complex component EXO70E2-like [Diospyros lotus]
MIWDCGVEEAYEYVRAVDEARKLTETLDNLCLSRGGGGNELLQRAHDVLQTAMARLEDEFRHILVQSRQPFGPEHMSFRSSEEDVVDEGSIGSSFGDDSVEHTLQCDSIMSRSSEEFIIDLVHPAMSGSSEGFIIDLVHPAVSGSLEESIIDLVHPAVIPDLKCIANLMFDSNYDRECTQAYISARKDALDDCLFILGVEKLSIEDVLKMERGTLNSKITGWIRAMKIFVRIYLASEKWLSDQIFEDLDSISSICFAEASKSSMLRLVKFGEAVAIGPHQPEKLFGILDGYEVLMDLIPDIDALYTHEASAGSSIRRDCQEVIRRLEDCVKATFLEFENAVAANTSTILFPGGGIHVLTRYVMNYIRALTDYSDALNGLPRDSVAAASFSPQSSPVSVSSSCEPVSPMALHFRSLTSILECNLQDKSTLYRDDSLRHLFLMNNIHYMTQKVKDSELRSIFGDEWIRRHNGKCQQHAMNYERATWSSILSLLRDDGIHSHFVSSSGRVLRALLKERLHGFYVAFKEVYKIQTGWVIPDTQLRDDLRISISLNVIQAYRPFVRRYGPYLTDKHIKHSAEDLESYLWDLFEGSPRPLLHNVHRRS